MNIKGVGICMSKARILGLTIIGALVVGSVSVYASNVWNVSLSSQKFIVNGQPTELNALNINGDNYLKIADMTKLLNVEVSYDEKSNSVYIDNSQSAIINNNNSNFGFSSQDNSTQIINNVDVKKLGKLEYVTLETYELSEGDIIHYDVSASGSGNLSLGFVKSGVDPANTKDRYFTTFDPGSNNTKTSTEPLTKKAAGKYSLYVCNISDQALSDIKGTVMIEKSNK